jgi:hypothetical protein
VQTHRTADYGDESVPVCLTGGLAELRPHILDLLPMSPYLGEPGQHLRPYGAVGGTQQSTGPASVERRVKPEHVTRRLKTGGGVEVLHGSLRLRAFGRLRRKQLSQPWTTNLTRSHEGFPGYDSP